MKLNVDYHQQELDNYCGPACAQMALSYAGVNLGLPAYKQSALLQTIQLLHEPLDTGPKGLAKVLNCRNPHYLQYHYDCVRSYSAPELFKAMTDGINKHNAPAIALVYGKWHWVVVHAVKDHQQGLMVHNPWPPIGTRFDDQEGFPNHDPFPDPHRCGDGRVIVRGEEGLHAPHYVDRGAKANHVSYQGWMCSYWRDAYDAAGMWHNYRVIVCPGDPTPGQEPCDNHDHTNVVTVAGAASGGCDIPGAHPVDASAAPGIAIAGMLRDGLQTEPLWQDILTHPPQVAQIQPVLRHDPAKRIVDYYLVWFTNQLGKRAVCARVDAQTGIYIESVAVPAGVGYPGQAITPIDAREHLYDIGYKARVRGNLLDISPNRLVDEPDVVWTYCDQSYSPFYPLYRYRFENTKVPGGPPVEVYMRTQGLQDARGPAIGFTILTQGKFSSPDDFPYLANLFPRVPGHGGLPR